MWFVGIRLDLYSTVHPDTMPKDQERPEHLPDTGHQGPDGPYVVGIGASAGGIEALQEFFRAVPAESGTAYVVILHLSPDHDSQLAQVLQHAATIPVTQVSEQVTIQADHVYVVPPNKVLRIDGNSIVVDNITRQEERRAPVDLFFRSLGDAQGSRAACVVLSGTGPNGSAGLKRVKEYGGLIAVQDPDTARYGDMPRNSIATGLVDIVAPASELPDRIAEFHQRTRSEQALGELASVATQADAMREILTVLRIRTGHDFSNYKPGTIQRRVARRIHLRELPDAQAYARYLRENPAEAVTLMKELLISVTNFFRDAAAFESVNVRVLPNVFTRKGRNDQVRVWVPACATGEEAYSIAMLLAEHSETSMDPPSIQVFATDLDEQAVTVAREAFYTNSDVADVSEQRLERFFVREPAGYRVRRELRETVLFATHNVIRDPPFSHLDLISCRNLLIYLNRTVQERVVETFHFALRPGGFLLLGQSETPESSNDLFAPVDKAAHIYESRTVTGRMPLPAADHHSGGGPPPAARLGEPRSASERITAGELHLRLLERYAPPSLVVTEDHHIVHMSQSVGRFLQVSGGEPSREVTRLARPELRPALRTALHQALLERRNIEAKDVPVVLDEGERRVDICVSPVLREDDPARGYLLITFDAQEPRAEDETRARGLIVAPEPVNRHLEEEVARMRQQLRATVEQYETQVEEAKASNEELQALNEELRSSAEEIETSKEELQSVNEELTTVNQELKIKIEELGLANNDFQNLINASDIGTIFLDRRLRVKLFTPSASGLFNLLRSDVGRPLSDITTHLAYPDLFKDLQQVVDELRTCDRECQTRDGHWVQVRLRPYRTMDDRIEGVVVTLQDITARRIAQEQVAKSEERLRLLIERATEYAIFTMDDHGVIDSWNAGAQRMFQYQPNEVIGMSAAVLFTAEDRAGGVPSKELRQAFENGRASDERFHVRKDGSRFYCSGMTLRLGESLGFAKIARDLSSQQQAADALRMVQADFELRVVERTGELEAEMRAREEAHRHVTVLLQRIVTAQEDERARIARDLHDHLGQQLTALRLTLQGHSERIAAGELDPGQVAHALSLAERIDSDLDFLAWELRPAALDDHGLMAALPIFVREWSQHYNIPVEYQAQRLGPGQLARDAEIVFYRVTQEALNNVLKHAHASRVDVLVEARDGVVRLVIEDNGVGFDPSDRTLTADKGIGIIGMHERAALIGGTLQIESQPGQGASVYLEAPCASDGNDA
jgi:two-component system, chemotaxis family, CheB/CheR fusion protein